MIPHHQPSSLSAGTSPLSGDDGITVGFPPTCPHCLHSLRPLRRASSDVWACPGCDFVRIA